MFSWMLWAAKWWLLSFAAIWLLYGFVLWIDTEQRWRKNLAANWRRCVWRISLAPLLVLMFVGWIAWKPLETLVKYGGIGGCRSGPGDFTNARNKFDVGRRAEPALAAGDGALLTYKQHGRPTSLAMTASTPTRKPTQPETLK